MTRNSQKIKIRRIAIGGVFSALCLTIMFFSGIIPFSMLMMPILAGAVMMIIVEECGRRIAFFVYIAVSLLSALIVADKEAVLAFISFFGYYPIIKSTLDRIPIKLISAITKLIICIAATLAGGYAAAYIFGLQELLIDIAEIGLLSAIVISFICILNDKMLAKIRLRYIYELRPRFISVNN